MKKVYIVNPKRTAIGAFQGTLSNTTAVELGATVIKAILDETKMPADMIDETIVGHVLQAGCLSGPARQISVKGGIPVEVSAYGVSIACGSGMKAVINAYSHIKAGVGEVYMAGGTENMTLAPYILPGARAGLRLGDKQIFDHIIYDGLEDAFLKYHMGVTAENVAEKYNITRLEQDEFAFASQEKAIKAIDNGVFKREIVPLTIKQRREEIVFETDEYPNRSTNIEKLSKLKPAFKDGGTVTAGNSSGINDGACFMLVVSEEALKKYNLTPIAEIIATGQSGIDPAYMGLGPVSATAKALKIAGIKFSDIEIIELTEAFAAQSLGVVTELANEHDTTKEDILSRLNPNGGAIALGHPIGASGARIITTLGYQMREKDVKYGLATLCIGGGMGAAVILKKI
ncbi:MAG: acetyl-CoA C-acetyltransferase [Oscillospiraceae bacterium]|jgi:acetyl-CoA C-acetyltransferase|nr:acetyl-CoA C-acetyltransferase [Oscillospiraceae bacterium]